MALTGPVPGSPEWIATPGVRRRGSGALTATAAGIRRVIPAPDRLTSVAPSLLPGEDLLSRLRRAVIGQDAALSEIVPFIDVYKAGLSAEGRPAGVFLLLGPTGTGKTSTVQALAKELHGNEKALLRVDCGEFQLDHEVAKLIGAPPGYLGHRETQPAITQQKLTAVASDRCGLSLVLFDEIEKAAPSLSRILLGITDAGTLNLGDNSKVSFEKTLIFLTSNLGSRELKQAQQPYGIAPAQIAFERVNQITIAAAKRKFSPEFMNRVDRVVCYRGLQDAAVRGIIDRQIEIMQKHLFYRLGPRAFDVSFTKAAKEWIFNQIDSSEYGAREIKRVMASRVLHKLALMYTEGDVAIEGTVKVGVRGGELSFTVLEKADGAELEEDAEVAE